MKSPSADIARELRISFCRKYKIRFGVRKFPFAFANNNFRFSSFLCCRSHLNSANLSRLTEAFGNSKSVA